MIGIVIATPGRRSLYRTLMSISYQRQFVEDILVVGDGYHKPTDELVEHMTYSTGLPVRYVATKKTRDWGTSQVNWGLKHVRGDWVVYQDDDDIFAPRALLEAPLLIRELDKPKPIIARVKTPLHGLLWQRPTLDTCLDGHCLLAPNNPRKLGWREPGYNGDQRLISRTLTMYDNEWAWADRVWSICRPTWELFPYRTAWTEDEFGVDFYNSDGGVAGRIKIASLLMSRDGDRWICSVDVHLEEGLCQDWCREIAQFACYASQGRDCWLQAPKTKQWIAALTDSNYHEHGGSDTRVEMIHDWPPDFWEPVPDFSHIQDQDMDWRDGIEG